MTRFSVVLPCYNAAATLDETLNSVLAQSLDDFEIIVVDDGSTDETLAIVERFAERCDRIRILRQVNQGPSTARNRAVRELAEGAYIAFLDADDVWPSDRLARIARRLDQADAPDAVYGRIAFFRDRTSDIETYSTVATRPLTVADLIAENATCTMSNVVVSRAAFIASGGFDADIVHGEDVEWLVRLAAAGARIEAIDAVLTYYRTSPTGLSSNLMAMRLSWETALATARAVDVDLTRQQIAAAEATHLRYLARRALRVESDRGTALTLSLKALRLSPLAYFRQPARGVLTLSAALVEALFPNAFRRLSPTQS